MNLNIRLEKRYVYILFSVLILLSGIFVVNAYNARANWRGSPGNPALIGHTADELMVLIDDQEMSLQAAIDGGYLVSTSDNEIVYDLVYGQHSSTQCINLGGTVEIDDNGNKFCKLRNICSQYGWARYGQWSTTSKTTCSYGGISHVSCSGTQACVCLPSSPPCTTRSHSFSEKIQETCITTGLYCGQSSGGMTSDQSFCLCPSEEILSQYKQLCYATYTEQGCY